MMVIDKKSRIPCYRQVYDQIQEEVLQGKIQPGHVLPGSRILARELGVGRNTIIHAYEQLETEGYIEAFPGIGFVVQKIAGLRKSTLSVDEDNRGKALPSLLCKDQVSPIRYDLTHGNLCVEFFPRRLWNRYMAEALTQNYVQVVESYQRHQGHVGLRRAIAAYLSRARAVTCSEDQIVLTTGLQQSLELICQLMFRKGGRLLMEEPGYDKARVLFENNGAEVVSIQLDDQGMCLEGFHSKGDEKGLYITPSYQFPTGTIMSVRRRYELLEWAMCHGAYIIEDDYNGEFRYDGNPIPSLQSIDVAGAFENVIYLGSVAKSLAPFSNISYVVLPHRLLDAYQKSYQLYSCSIPWTDQYVVQRLIEEGYYEKHLRKVRNAFRKRHDLLIHELSALGPSVGLVNRGAGLYFILKIRAGLSHKELHEHALEQGVRIGRADRYWANKPQCPKDEVFLGFSLMDLKDIEDCVMRLKRAWLDK